MPVDVRIPRVLRGHTRGQSVVQVDALTLGDLLDRLYEAFPTLKSALQSSDGDVLDHTNVFINDVEVREIGGLAAKLQSGDTVTILPSMAGGRGQPGLKLLRDRRPRRWRRVWPPG